MRPRMRTTIPRGLSRDEYRKHYQRLRRDYFTETSKTWRREHPERDRETQSRKQWGYRQCARWIREHMPELYEQIRMSAILRYRSVGE